MDNIVIVGSYAPSLRNFRGELIEALNCGDTVVHAVAPNLNSSKVTSEWFKERNIPTHDIDISRAGLNPLVDLISFFKLAMLLKRLRPKLFIGYTIKPVVWGIMAAWIARTPKRVALITGLGYAFTEPGNLKRIAVRKAACFLYKLSLKRSTHIFFQNTDDRDEFIRLGLVPDNIPTFVVNGSGVNVEIFRETPLPQHPIRFLLISRLLGDKGIREYAQAAAIIRRENPDIEFHLVGGLDTNPNSISRSEIELWQKKGDIVWHGEAEDVRPHIALSHVYVLPSYREGTPRTVLESMAMGRPILTSDAPGCRDTVVDGKNGFLIRPKDTENLVLGMQKFIKNPDSIRQMGKESRKIAENKYDVHTVNSSMISSMGLSPQKTQE